MRPKWFRCETCLLGTKEEMKTTLCHVNRGKVNNSDYFCKEWICANCWNSWDTCDYPDTKKDWVGVYHDHNNCGTVKFKGE